MEKDHFKNMFKEPHEVTIAQVIRVYQLFPRYVEEEENDMLMTPVTKEEVEGVLKMMQKYKILGPDGWTMENFQHLFELVGDELTGAVEEYQVKGYVYEHFNAAFMALVLKSDDQSSFEEFRPIYLCNCIYKIIAKVIVVRLNPTLSSNISKE